MWSIQVIRQPGQTVPFGITKMISEIFTFLQRCQTSLTGVIYMAGSLGQMERVEICVNESVIRFLLPCLFPVHKSASASFLRKAKAHHWCLNACGILIAILRSFQCLVTNCHSRLAQNIHRIGSKIPETYPSGIIHLVIYVGMCFPQDHRCRSNTEY